MSKELRQLTDGTYLFTETRKSNQYLFFRTDNEVLENVGSTPIELFAQYLVLKDRNGELKQDTKYASSIQFEISDDRKVIRLTVSDNQHYKSECHTAKVKKAEKRPNFFKKMFGKKG